MKREVLNAKNITKIYDQGTEHAIYALNNVSLTINEGDFMCVMGPSGSGKSTLINSLSTIDVPTKGEVFINGVEIRSMSMKEKGDFRFHNLGFIFQNFNLLDSLTVEENIAVPLTLAEEEQNEITKKVEMIAKKIGIDQILSKYPNECSRGQCQRVAIARALINNPTIIIADEPTGNLDTQNSHELMEIFKELNKNNVTILMVTHSPVNASYSSKLLYIKDGKIEYSLEKGNMTQKEYFSKIMAINSSESQKLLL